VRNAVNLVHHLGAMRRTWGIDLAVAVLWLAPVQLTLAGDPHPNPAPRAVAAPAVAFERDDLPGPQLEVATHAAGIEVPALPPFDLPATEPGFRSPRELRVRGRPLLGTEVKVSGYVTWAYHCAAVLELANPNATRAQIDAAIHADPTLCGPPAFSLGDTSATSRDASISVVSPDGKPGTRAAPPRGIDPGATPLAPGDYVTVTGPWIVPAGATSYDRDGVLAWSAVERATPPATAAAAAAELQPMEMMIDGPPKIPMRRIVDEQTVDASIEHTNACNKAIVARQYETAIAECQAATTTWDGNHLAWYAWAGAHMARREWSPARTAIERAVALRPDLPMYQLYHGIVLYEAAHERARSEPSRKPVSPTLKLDAARDALRNAIRLAPELWRAHFYLGRVFRELDDSRRAAAQFTATIKNNPAYQLAYIALIEIYRRWDYIEQALAVATLGTTQVTGADAADLWFEIGIIHDARRADDKAIEAFSNAMAARPDDAGAKFERAQLYLRKGDLASAQRDLRDVARSADPRAGVTKQLAAQLLGQLAASRPGGPPPRLPSWQCTRGGFSSALECRPR
jgi:tetratricopeptide (TPR) repeat protein